MTWRTALAPVLAFLSACASPVAAMGDDGPPPPKSAVIEAASNDSASKPMVIHNPDGTITVRKKPSKSHAKDIKGKKGLVVPAQVVAPTFSAPEKMK
jgi:hypothetical protein